MREELAIRATGHLVDLEDLPAVAQTLDDLREFETQIRDAKRILTDALQQESERQGTRTFHFDDVTVELSSPIRVEYDLEALAEMLADAGLPAARVNEVIVPIVSYRLDGNVARQLRGANPAYAAALDQCRLEIPKTVYATVKRKGQP